MEPIDAVRAVADAVVREKTPTDLPWRWGPGTLNTGMLYAYERTAEERYLDFVRDWADHYRGNLGDILTSEYNYCGFWGPGLAILKLYDTTGEERFAEMAKTIVEFVLVNGARTDSGAFGHNSTDWSNQLWADTVYMVVPTLSAGGRLLDDPSVEQSHTLADYQLDPGFEAVRQLHIAAQLLQDTRTGLFAHFYDGDEDRGNGIFWGRGNGWVAMSYVEALKDLAAESETDRELVYQFGRHLQGLLAHQDDSGMLTQVVDNPEAYAETSASAMTLFALAEVKRHDLFAVPYDDRIDRLWEGVNDQINDDGTVGGVSGGQGSHYTEEPYLNADRGINMNWGAGSCLMAASALAMME